MRFIFHNAKIIDTDIKSEYNSMSLKEGFI